MDLKSFQLGMRAISASMPYGKKLQDDELAFLYMLLPEQVKAEVTDDLWAYACSQTLKEQDPNTDIPLHMRVLSHVYRIENGTPNFKWGLKVDSELLACGNDPVLIEAYKERQHRKRMGEWGLLPAHD